MGLMTNDIDSIQVVIWFTAETSTSPLFGGVPLYNTSRPFCNNSFDRITSFWCSAHTSTGKDCRLNQPSYVQRPYQVPPTPKTTPPLRTPDASAKNVPPEELLQTQDSYARHKGPYRNCEGVRYLEQTSPQHRTMHSGLSWIRKAKIIGFISMRLADRHSGKRNHYIDRNGY